MLRLLIQRTCGRSQIPKILRSGRVNTSIRSFATSPHPSNKSEQEISFQRTYDSKGDYSSYKLSIFTHRLPETTAKQSFQLSTLSQCLNLISDADETNGLANNYGLSHLLLTYPRLPTAIHNAAVDSYMGVHHYWRFPVGQILGQESEFMKFGRLRYLKESQKSDKYYTTGQRSITGVQEHAYSKVVSGVIGGLYTHSGEPAAKEFIKDHILSRKPIKELVRLCDKLEFKDPVTIRLIAETGRLSSEAIGGSLKEAEQRAAVNALLGYYLYSPINEKGEQIGVPSDKDYKFEGVIDIGDVAI
ncbi:54S ribosomal protein L3, mitochondrial [Candida viswanathii]|uniref:54S ribosomal protein L3, mitochondrial n=1 Tax=Candida viswanathii TaxID=5486 RepID=A0A367XPW1_9ASCO|nr:54S ribosomal protein L3, mitochondrial [Candida viswanathii]